MKNCPAWRWPVSYTHLDVYKRQGLRSLIDATGRAVAYDQNIMNIINEEIQTFMNGTKTAEQTASLIQDRVSLYVNEQR